MKPTRFPELNYQRVIPGLWRFIDASTLATVGPHYSTERELLADMQRYAELFGCMAAAHIDLAKR